MKVETKESKFDPIIITLESQKELDCLLICLNMTDETFTENANSLLEGDILGSSAVDSAKKLYGTLYNQLEDLY